jgi:hypothetical protein
MVRYSVPFVGVIEELHDPQDVTPALSGRVSPQASTESTHGRPHAWDPETMNQTKYK